MRLTYVRVQVSSLQEGFLASAWCHAPGTSESAIQLHAEIERELHRLVAKAGGWGKCIVRQVIDTIDASSDDAEDAPSDMVTLTRIRGLKWRYERRYPVKDAPNAFRWRQEVAL